MLSNNLAATVEEAVNIGNLLMAEGWLAHVANEHSFKNEKLFYRFTSAIDWLDGHASDPSGRGDEEGDEAHRQLTELQMAAEQNIRGLQDICDSQADQYNQLRAELVQLKSQVRRHGRAMDVLDHELTSTKQLLEYNQRPAMLWHAASVLVAVAIAQLPLAVVLLVVAFAGAALYLFPTALSPAALPRSPSLLPAFLHSPVVVGDGAPPEFPQPRLSVSERAPKISITLPEAFPAAAVVSPVVALRRAEQDDEEDEEEDDEVSLDANGDGDAKCERIRQPESALKSPLVAARNMQQVASLQALLAQEFPESSWVFTDAYLASVLAVPGRTTDYAFKKMVDCLTWRRKFDVASLCASFGLLDGAFSIAPAQYVPDSRVIAALSVGSLYWRGYDNLGRPILWVRPQKKNWKAIDVEAELRMHVLMIEFGLRLFLPPGVTMFTLVADASGMGVSQINFNLFKSLLELVKTAYPDRLGLLCVGPLNIFVSTVFKLLRPLMPQRLSSKIVLYTKVRREIVQSGTLSSDDVPTFFKGPAVHDWKTTRGSPKSPSPQQQHQQQHQQQQHTFPFDRMVALMLEDLNELTAGRLSVS